MKTVFEVRRFYSPAYKDAVAPPTSCPDTSRFKNHGTFVNHTAWVQLPSGLWVMSFDGADDAVTCGTGAAVAGSMTILTWVYRTGDLSTHRRIIAKADDGNTIQYNLYVNTAGAYSASLGSNQSSNFPSTANRWEMTGVTVALDGTYIFYLDGVADTPIAAPLPSLAFPASTLTLGNLQGLSRYWGGMIGLPRVWPFVVSAATFAKLFLNERPYFYPEVAR